MRIGDIVAIKPDFADLALGSPEKGSAVKVVDIKKRDNMAPLIKFLTSCGMEGQLFRDAFVT